MIWRTKLFQTSAYPNLHIQNLRLFTAAKIECKKWVLIYARSHSVLFGALAPIWNWTFTLSAAQWNILDSRLLYIKNCQKSCSSRTIQEWFYLNNFFWQFFCQNRFGHPNRLKNHIKGCKWLIFYSNTSSHMNFQTIWMPKMILIRIGQVELFLFFKYLFLCQFFTSWVKLEPALSYFWVHSPSIKLYLAARAQFI